MCHGSTLPCVAPHYQLGGATLERNELDSQTLHKNLIHNKAMEKKMLKRQLVVVGTLSLIAVVNYYPAQAEPTPTPTPSPTSTVLRTPIEQYKFDREMYIAAVKARDVAIRSINQSFNFSIKKADADFRLAMQLARTPDQKFQANNSRKVAISNAITARDTAISLLGTAPTPPAEPLKMAKTKIGKEKKR